MKDIFPYNEIAIRMQNEVKKAIKGLDSVVYLITVGLFAHGHILLEGLPGVAKTATLRAFAKTIGNGGFSRVSGTPDLMPMDFLFDVWPRLDRNADWNACGQKLSELHCFPGPLLKYGENLVVFLVDEINRLQPKTQSVLLEAMQEKAVTCGGQRFRLPHFTLVATRNPLETEETSELPEAQRDRFLFEVQVKEPSDDVMKQLIRNPLFQNMDELVNVVGEVIELEKLCEIRRQIQEQVHISDALANYILDLARATWKPSWFNIKITDEKNLEKAIRAGFSPRARMALAQASRVVAWVADRDYVLPEDVKKIFLSFANHRLFLTKMSIGRRSGLATEILSQILEKVPAPRNNHAEKR